MPRRLQGSSPTPQVSIEAFGDPATGCAGESLAATLLASGNRVFARSPKYHRPRGPFCFAGRCSHCLVRIDGIPNRMACRTPIHQGMRVEPQNVLGSAALDALGTLDFLFPKGLDHHEMFAGVPIAEQVMARVARQLAGLGLLPEHAPTHATAFESVEVDVAVVGAGPAGLALAESAVAAGLKVLLIDENRNPGGRLRARIDSDELLTWSRGAAERIAKGGRMVLSATALGAYRSLEGPFLAIEVEGIPPKLMLVKARRFALCPGGSESVPPFENNDLPGVMAARGMLAMVAEEGVIPSDRAVVLAEHNEGFAVARRLQSLGIEVAAVVHPPSLAASPGLPCIAGSIESASGTQGLSGVEIHQEGGGKKRLSTELLVVSSIPSPQFALPRQLGLRADHEPGTGFPVSADGEGRTSIAHLAIAGEVAGRHDARSAQQHGARAGAAIAAALNEVSR